MKDRDIRAALKAQILPGIYDMSCSRIIGELDLGWSSRVDLAVVGKQLDAFEIKSDSDSIARLKDHQLEMYLRYCDTVTVISGVKLVGKVLDLCESTPAGVVQVRECNGAIEFLQRKPADVVEHTKESNYFRLLSLPLAYELKQISPYYLPYPKSVTNRASKAHLARALSEALCNDDVRLEVCEALRTRWYKPNGDNSWDRKTYVSPALSPMERPKKDASPLFSQKPLTTD